MKKTKVFGGALLMCLMGLLTLAGMGSVATAAALRPPYINKESATEITSTNAILSAEIDPNGAYTAYQFQIDTSESYDFTQLACPLEVPEYAQCMGIILGKPLPPGLVEPEPGAIAAGSYSQSVSIDLASVGATLQSETTYHFRAIASNSDQIVYGPDQTFTTPEAGAYPLVEPAVGTSGGALATSPGVASFRHRQGNRRAHRRHRRESRHGRSRSSASKVKLSAW